MAILIIEHSDITGSERLGTRLIRDGHKLLVVRVHRGEELPKTLDEIDGIVCCGGPQEPTHDEPWVEHELHLLREADTLQIPVLGICLGAQLLTRALGGELSTLEAPEIGWYELSLSPTGREDVLFAGQPWQGPQLHWHHFEIKTLPEGAKLLASSDRCKNQAWVKGISTYAVQFHPECTRKTITAWIADEDKASGIDGNLIEEETNLHFADYERLTDRFFEAVSQILMPMQSRLQRQRH